MEHPGLSVIIPCLNEEGSVRKLHQALLSVLAGAGISYEIIFVDDGSVDNSPFIIRELAERDIHTGAILLTRNFGHQNALLAGMQEARGDLILTMDADLQHPPELIPAMLEKLGEGFEVVAARRVNDRKRKGFKSVSSRGFYRLVNLLSDVHIPSGVADFRLMTRWALDDFLRFGERGRFSRGLVSWMGYPQGLVDFEAPARSSGKSKYSRRRMFAFAFDGISSFSSKPLRMAFSFGLFLSLAGLLYALYAIIMFFRGATVSGWTSLLVSVLIIGGVQLISLGIIGEYLGRIFNEAKQRPHFFIRERINRPD